MSRHVIETDSQVENWNSTYNTVTNLSSGWGGGGGDDVLVSTKVRASSANWDDTYTTVTSLSSEWGSGMYSLTVETVKTLTQVEYDALIPDDATLYIITDANTLGAVFSQIREITTNYTIIPTIDHKINVTANTVTIFLPSAIGLTGYEFIVKNSGTGTATLSSTTISELIDANQSKALLQYEAVEVTSTGSKWIITSSM